MNKKVMVFGLSSMLFSTMILSTAVQAQAQDHTQTTHTQSKEGQQVGTSVSTWEQFKAAIEDETVTDITLANDLTLESKIYVSGTVKNIHGDGFTIDADKHQIEINKDNTVGLIENCKIRNTEIYGLFWSPNKSVEVTYKNIDHQGNQLIYLPNGKLILDGTVTSNSTLEEVFQGKELELLPNSKVNFQNSSTGLSPVSQLGADSSLKVGKGATFTVNSNAISIKGGSRYSLVNEGTINATSAKHTAIHGATDSIYEFKDGSSLKAIAHDTVEEGMEATSGSIYVRKGASFEVESQGTQGTVIAGDELVFEEGSNFSVTNNNSKGAILGTYPVPSSVSLASSKGLNTWNRGNVSAAIPDKAYQNFTSATFELSGYLNTVSQTNMVTSDSDFASNYKTGEVGKITGGSYANSTVESPSFNAVTDQDTQITGTGVPGATINAYVNGNLIGTAIVSADGNWIIDIASQLEGTQIDVDQTIEGITSDKVSQVVSHEQVAVDKPGFNVVNDRDKQLTGTGIPGATINAYVNGNLIGTTTVGQDSRWTMDIPVQTAGTQVDVDQTVGQDTSGKVTQIVSHLDSQTVNFFKLGYWQPYGLILEGSIDNGDLDLTNSAGVKKTISLTDSTGNSVLTNDAANTDWYNSGVFNGYQAILENDKLDALPIGEYKISIGIEVGDYNDVQDLNVGTTTRSGYHNVFSEIEKTTVGQRTVSTVDKNGVGYLVVE